MANELDENLDKTSQDEAKMQETPIDVLKKQLESPQPELQAEPEQPQEPAPSPVEEGKTEETVPEPPQEELIGGKFKTQEELLKAYQEMEKKSTKDAQLRSHYHDTLSPHVEFDEEGNVIGLKPQTPPPQTIPPIGQTQQQQVVDMLEQRYNALEGQVGPVKANIILQAEIANAITKQALTPVDELKADRSVETQKSRMRNLHSDFANYENEVNAYLNKMDPQSKANPNAVETVYYIVKGKKSEELVKTKEEEARAKTTEIEEQKSKAQVEHQTKTPEEPKVNIEGLTSNELAAHLKLKRFDRY